MRDCLETLCSEGRVIRVTDFSAILEQLEIRIIGDSYKSSLRSFETPP